MEVFNESEYYFDESSGIFDLFVTSDLVLAAIKHFPVQHVNIMKGGGDTSVVIFIIQYCQQNDISIEISYGLSAGTWYALSEYVNVPKNTLLEMHGMGIRKHSTKESLNFLRYAETRLHNGVVAGVFKESRVKYLIRSFNIHIHSKPANFWDDIHPTNFWYYISELADK